MKNTVLSSPNGLLASAGNPPPDALSSGGTLSSPPDDAIPDAVKKTWDKFMAVPDNAYITQREVCALLRCGYQTLWRQSKSFPEVFGRVKFAGEVQYLKYQVEIMALYLEGRMDRDLAIAAMERKTQERIGALLPNPTRNRRAAK